MFIKHLRKHTAGYAIAGIGLVINALHLAYYYFTGMHITVERMLEHIKVAPYEHAVTYLAIPLFAGIGWLKRR